MYFEDLTLYSYSEIHSGPNIYNIGWLDAKHSFPTGVVSEDILNKILKMCLKRVVGARGFHQCNICKNPPSGPEVPLGSFPVMTEQGELFLGSAEIRVLGEEGKIYAAPNLIYHYIKGHDYLPPQEFLDAVEQWEPI
ncbi:MAG: hypothetical protein MI923_17970 [Phycisphaerales bacterium]|nr:hypothetical protein [Phycisphaerales bacterium]